MVVLINTFRDVKSTIYKNFILSMAASTNSTIVVPTPKAENTAGVRLFPSLLATSKGKDLLEFRNMGQSPYISPFFA